MDFAAALLGENKAFGELIRGADPSTPVPTCPDWTLKQLFRHVGRGERWAAQIVAERRDVDPRTVEGGKPPEDPDAAIAWLSEGSRQLVDAVEKTGADTPVWTFLGPRPAAWWLRRRCHEILLHRADAALALGQPFTAAPELAADGLSELLDLTTALAVARGQAPSLAEDQTVHLHATDPGLGEQGEWTISAADGRLGWGHSHGKGSVAVRGGATDLLLAVSRRVPVTDTEAEVFGDLAVWQSWLGHTAF
ncbi:maleylpyruvate isomerase family mycothiol-dependent enzyme [Mycobacterium sp. pUA109]|uniref:maleylpyruvate isomerase family mycothiol-dependent enzyme n=1 Tax=Mycobacterium sp. pUA109 TaxID=3238982 RepID=UPI00351B0876